MGGGTAVVDSAQDYGELGARCKGRKLEKVGWNQKSLTELEAELARVRRELAEVIIFQRRIPSLEARAQVLMAVFT